jgi:hypothetical protein
MVNKSHHNSAVSAVALGALSVFSLELFTCGDTCINYFFFYPLFIFTAFVLSMYFFTKKPFTSAGLVTFGVFLGIILHLIIFPNTKDGFERNLFPLEILLHTIIGALTCFIPATIWYFFHERK